MHELSIAANLLELAEEELRRHGAEKLLLLRVRYGVLSQIMPEALRMAFQSLVHGGVFAGVKLEMREEFLVLACGSCKKKFTPEDASPFAPCPACGGRFCHEVVQGKGLFLEHLEVE